MLGKFLRAQTSRAACTLSQRRQFSTSKEGDVYVSQKVGDFTLSRKGRNFEEVLEVEVRKETLLQAQDQINANLNKFAKNFKVTASEEPENGASKKATVTFDFSKLSALKDIQPAAEPVKAVPIVP